jgi:sensor histidine kinase YesM
VLRHVAFWLAWVLSFTVIQRLGFGSRQYFVWLMYYIVTLPVFIAHTYLIAYWLIPLVRKKGNYIFFVLVLITFLVVFSIIELVMSNELVFKVFDINKSFSPGYLNFKNIIVSGIGNHFIILVFFAIKAGRSLYSSKNIKEELMQTKMETELGIYKYQLQPRLILSLLDELDEITWRDAEKAPDMIIKISGFLNRFLFEGSEELVPLQSDVELIREFLEIHQHAVGSRLKSNFFAVGNLKSFVVPPFLLLPFLNSAIKMVYTCNESFDCSVIVKGEKKYLLYSFTFWSESEFQLNDEENIAITRKRLNYTYPGKFRLVENLDENYKEINLEIYI